MNDYLQWALIISILGIVNTLYLIYHALRKTDVYCLFFPKEWCQKVQHSKYSKTMGIPNPYLGFGMLTAIAVLLYFYSTGVLPSWPAMGLITFGFLFSLYFFYIQAFIIRAFCTWCVLSAVVFTLLFGLQFFI